MARRPKHSMPSTRNKQLGGKPSPVINPQKMPIYDKPPATDSRWGQSMGVPSMNPANPYEEQDDVHG